MLASVAPRTDYRPRSRRLPAGPRRRNLHPRKGVARRMVCLFAWATLLVMPLAGAQEETSPDPATEGADPMVAMELRFQDWLSELRQEAHARGISSATLDAALQDIEPITRVIELDRDQPEFKLTFDEYLDRVVPPSRVETGRRLLAEHQELLGQIHDHFGVPPRYLVALWGVESDFGRLQGGFPVVPALATLAFDGRRGSYFRGELLTALEILDEGHVKVGDFMGSWAGAMGQCQFMPSSFARHAIDFDGDGRQDIWNSKADVFASAANYLAQSGWQERYIWGRRVRLPEGFDVEATGLEVKRPLSQWQALGVRRADGQDLPREPDLQAAVVLPDGPEGPAFVVYRNFEVLMTWNRSIYFATAVGILADRLIGIAG